MKSSIVAGLEAQTAQEVKTAFTHSKQLRERLTVMLEAKLVLSRKEARKKDAHEGLS